jgi:hypothetical protein
MGERMHMTMGQLLLELGLQDTGGKTGSRNQLKRRLDRLSGAHMIVTTKREGHTIRITTGLLKWGLVEETSQIYIRLDPDGAKLFDSLAYQPWKVRLALRSDTAALLLSYVCSHQAGKPHSVLLESLQQWCRYPGRARDWRRTCMAGLAELEARGVLERGSSELRRGANGEVVSWRRGAAMLPSDAGI